MKPEMSAGSDRERYSSRMKLTGRGSLPLYFSKAYAEDSDRLVDHHAVQKAQRPLVRVVEDGEDGVLRIGVAEALEMHLVLADDELLHFGGGERRQACVAGDQNRLERLAGCGLELAVVLQGVVLGGVEPALSVLVDVVIRSLVVRMTAEGRRDEVEALASAPV